ncbi:hypothetical protein GUJ93_ZPchr0003g16465 [Zizania palustris]|uniref:RING-type E3 ubiquitin transferase n=1 Tax=Zizania palustris TaxID=103762 RepID=A0A8J5VX59_ZIZPA|nr:hypothetical protein GUJ93_ZPchr0003g16465 [Zizania palustris]
MPAASPASRRLPGLPPPPFTSPASAASPASRRIRRLPGLEEHATIMDFSRLYEVSNVVDEHGDMRLDIDNMTYEELLALEEQIGDVNTVSPTAQRVPPPHTSPLSSDAEEEAQGERKDLEAFSPILIKEAADKQGKVALMEPSADDAALTADKRAMEQVVLATLPPL